MIFAVIGSLVAAVVGIGRCGIRHSLFRAVRAFVSDSRSWRAFPLVDVYRYRLCLPPHEAVANDNGFMTHIRPCRDDDRAAIAAIINAAAEAYRGVIPADRWHEPYMGRDELDREIAAGVVFWGYEADGRLAGVMGFQPVRDVDLIRHAYVVPTGQRRGIGGALLGHLRQLSQRRLLVGTWAAADWAIRFYQRHGFALVSPARKAELLKTYWDIPERQIEVSVVLESPPTDDA
jgi:GNAT superfamily N-acetyltransferase